MLSRIWKKYQCYWSKSRLIRVWKNTNPIGWPWIPFRFALLPFSPCFSGSRDRGQWNEHAAGERSEAAMYVEQKFALCQTENYSKMTGWCTLAHLYCWPPVPLEVLPLISYSTTCLAALLPLLLRDQLGSFAVSDPCLRDQLGSLAVSEPCHYPMYL